MKTSESIVADVGLVEGAVSAAPPLLNRTNPQQRTNGESYLDRAGHAGRREQQLVALLSQVEWLAVGQDLGLSTRECAVVRHILEGEKLTAIADDMDLGLGTVKTYCCRIYQKLRVSTHSALAVVVLCRHFSVPSTRSIHKAKASREPTIDSRATSVGRRDDISVADLSSSTGTR
jgi:DNA-binding CsgD family transcriptional regulator